LRLARPPHASRLRRPVAAVVAFALFLLAALAPALAVSGSLNDGRTTVAAAVAGAEGAPSDGGPEGGTGPGASSLHGACPCHHPAGGPVAAPMPAPRALAAGRVGPPWDRPLCSLPSTPPLPPPRG
jgi:hypothetical protein